MMCDTTGRTVDWSRTVVEAVQIPVTVKMRLGWDDEQLTAPFFAREFEQAGVAGDHHPRPHARAGLRRHGQPRRHPAPWSRRSSASRSSATATCARSPTPPACSQSPAATAIAIGRGALLEPVVLPPARPLGGDRRPGPAADLRRAARLHGRRHLRRLCGLARRALRLPAVPQGGELVLPGAQAGPRGAADAGDARHVGDFERSCRWLREQGPPPGWQAGAAPTIPVPKGPNERW